MIQLDASLGEGGGQVLRSALTLSLLSGGPVELRNIRAGRAKPGLQPQHLQAVRAAAAAGGAEVEGAALLSQTLRFAPGRVAAGDYRFDIGTAGAVSLVLQTVLVPLALAAGASTLTLVGGTHVPRSPAFETLVWSWLPLLARLGIAAQVEMERAGFYPPGGGVVHARIAPSRALSPLHLQTRGPLREVHGVSAVARLDAAIAARQRQQAMARLGGLGVPVEIGLAEWPARSPGTCIALVARCEGIACCFHALGARGKPAERVADEACHALQAWLHRDGALEPHLADQMILPLLCVPGESAYTVSELTPHLMTNAAVVEAFLPGAVRVDGQVGGSGRVSVSGAGFAPGRG